MKRLVIFLIAVGLLGSLALTGVSTTNLRTYTVQEALNYLVGAKPHEYTTQEALNLITTKPSQRDTLVGLFTWVWDDGLQEVYDSLSVFTANDQVCSVALIVQNNLHGETDSTYLTRAQINTLYDAGWTFGSHSYNAGTYPMVATGKYSSMDTFITEVSQAYTAIKDTLGLPAPRWFSYPGSGYWPDITRIVSQYHEFAFSAEQVATGHSLSYARQQNRDYVVNTIWGGASNDYLAAYPGVTTSEYGIAQCVGENDTWANFRADVLDAVAYKGWCVFIGHKTTTLATSTGQSMQTICAFLDSLQDAGKLRVVTAEEGFDLMYRTPVSPAANFIHPDFGDNNGDGLADMFTSTTYDNFTYYDSTYSASTGGNSVTGTDNYGHGGYGYATLDWDAGGTNNGHDDAVVTYPHEQRECEWFLPVPGGGQKSIRFSAFAQYDPNVHSWASGDSIGVSFTGVITREYNRWGGSFAVSGIESSANARWTATRNGQANAGNHAILTAADSVGGNWIQLVASWPVPDDCHAVYVDLWKDSNLETGAVRVSNPSISWEYRDPTGRW